MSGPDVVLTPRSLVQPSAQSVIADADTKASELKASACALRIIDAATRARAVDLRASIKGFLSKADELRTGFVKPLNDHVKRINDAFKKSTAPAAEALCVLDKEILRDSCEQQRLAEEHRRMQQFEQEQARKAAEEEQAARAREIAAAAETVAKEAGMTESEAKQMGQPYAADELAKPPVEKPVQVIAILDPPKTTKSAAGAAVTVKKTWDFEVTDLTALALVLPAALEIRRKIVLDHLREIEALGHDVESVARKAGIRAFKRDLVSG